MAKRKMAFVPKAGAVSVAAVSLQPFKGFAEAVAADVARELGLANVPGLEVAMRNAARRYEADEREAAAQAEVNAPGRKVLKRRKDWPTESSKPTPEHAGRGVYETVAGETLDIGLKGERTLVNRTARAGGAATMFARGQISKRELMAAERLCMDFELSQASQLSGLPMSERVQGGTVDTSGSRLRAASIAYGKYRDALEGLTTAGRVLVENVIVGRMAMENAVQLRTVKHRMGRVQHMDNLRNRAFLILCEALEKLADHYGLATS